ncbi:hypothetical protein [Geminocystis sp. GBBB08]|uniref:hypothetical protein n=1 Tax=Geminocystis sp. GBBB08 TaxID=2604140 RepID=UPI0027E34CB2|nr:hypothetical protein [Geminocystis sp. GBBB08]MBL1211221.1 hypothetical protein [Geminocystis sp. GBBB08]
MNNQKLLQPILRQFALGKEFEAQMGEIFGENSSFDFLQQQWLNGSEVLPTVEIVSSSVINGALGAYSQQTKIIYLSQELIGSNNKDLITKVLLEEYGHYIDSQVNLIDSRGDEGELFSAFVRGEIITAEKIARIKQENDNFDILVNGQTLQIEASGSISANGVNRIREGIDGVLGGLQNTLYQRLLSNTVVKSVFGDGLENSSINSNLQYLDSVRLKLSGIAVKDYLPSELVTTINGILNGTGATISYSSTTNEFNLSFTKSNTNSLAIDTNLGIPTVGLNFTGNLSLTTGFTGGINFSAVGDSFSLKPTTAKELTFTLSAKNSSNLNGKLGFLNLTAGNNGSNNALFSDFTLSADVNGSGGIENISPTANLKVNSLLNLGGGSSLPNFKTNLVFDANNPTLQFKDVKLGLSSVLGTVNPFITKIKGITDQFKPLLDFLSKPLPVLDKLGVNYSLLDLAETPIFKAYAASQGLPPIDTSFIKSLTTVTNIINTLGNLSVAGDVPLGNFSLNNLSQFNPNLDFSKSSNIVNLSDFVNGLNSAKTQFDNAIEPIWYLRKLLVFSTLVG